MARHALLIGVSEFADQRLARLNAPANDVIALRGILQDSSRGSFDSVELSVNEDILTVRDHLSHFLLSRFPDDVLLLYYSGHGILGSGNRLFLATGDSNLDTPRSRSISAREIRDFMEESRAQRQIVVLDCCHSGAFAEHAKAAAPPPAITQDTFSSGDAGLYVLTAADTLQFAWDGTELRAGDEAAAGFSQFTSWLVEGLEKGEAAPDDEQITMDALYRYLSRRARSEGSAATPQRFVQGGVGDLVISANPLIGFSQIDRGVLEALAAEEFRTRLGAVTELTLQMDEVHTVAARAAHRLLQRHLQHERDYQVRRAITRALEQGSNRPFEAARQAEEERRQAEAARRAEQRKRRVEAARRAKEKQRAEAARQAEEEKHRAEAARQAEEEKHRAEAARQAEEEKHRAKTARFSMPLPEAVDETHGDEKGKSQGRVTSQPEQRQSGQPSALVNMLSGHRGEVFSLALLSDGVRALSGSGDRTMRLWDLHTGAELRRFDGHQYGIFSIVVLADGRRALSGSGDGTIRVWDLETAAELRQFDCDRSAVNSVAVLPDGRRALYGSHDGTLRVWDLETGVELRRLQGHRDAVMSVAVLPDGRRAISGSRDQTLLLWDLDAGVELRRFEGHSGWVLSVAALQDGWRALSGSDDHTTRLWDLGTGAELSRLEDEGSVTSVAIFPDGRLALSGSGTGIINVWDLQTGAMLSRLEGHKNGVYAIAISPSGRWVLSGSGDSTLRRWEIEAAGAV